MKTEFIQAVLNKKVEDMLTTRFSVIRQEEVDPEEMKRSLKKLERDGLIKMIQDTGQDPDEMAKMFLVAVDHACETLKRRLQTVSAKMVDAIKEKAIQV